MTNAQGILRTSDPQEKASSESTPLLGSGAGTSPKMLWGKLRAATYVSFTRRRSTALRDSSVRKSVRPPLIDLLQEHDILEPVDGLSPLAAGGVIVCTDGYRTTPRPPSTVKSLPAFAPFRRTERHRSFYLWWINEFRHWWKSSRLLVRLAGLWTLAITLEFLAKMESVEPYRRKRKANAKNTERALRLVKKLGRGGPMRWFLQTVQPFTRTLRIVVGSWRWIEAAQCRRLEVGVEEFMVSVLDKSLLNLTLRLTNY